MLSTRLERSGIIVEIRFRRIYENFGRPFQTGGFILVHYFCISMSLVQIEKPQQNQIQKHLASDILIHATEKKCSGVRCKKVDGEKQYCVLGLLRIYS